MNKLFLTAFLSITAISLDASSQGSPQKNKLAAVVNKSAITVTDLNNRVKLAALSAGLEANPEAIEKMKPQMLRTMIEEKLQLQAAKENDIKIEKDAIEKAMKSIEEGNGMKPGQLTQLLKDNNIPLKTLQDQIQAQLTWMEFVSQKYAPTLQISDWEIDQEFEKHTQNATQTQYHLAEIFLNVDSPEKEGQVQQDFERLIQQLQAGAHFSALAQQFSQSATAAKGGDMGWLSENALTDEISPAVKSMTPGDLSRPIRTAQGYILLGLIDRKMPGESQSQRLDVLQTALPYPPGATEAQAMEVMQKLESLLKTTKSCADLDVAIKKAGGQSARNANARLDAFPEAMRKILASLEVNNPSQPLMTESGGLAVMVCNRTEEKAKEFSKDDALHLIADKRLALLARRELRDLKRAAYIDLRQ
ncbi:Peptidylprolyl isomerase [Candidatus Bealeia paramacronuclearis]|uniref:Parvulin-like PPIase n=1 Tax=Candidatus Bealeia paramacronuclearis TaxID=1921001 RepID=A0ABZ2C709_9PROT|nr:Peptidylprolyl isomerase [Candidatus Bealeia paramacronuclearis]